MSDQTTERKFDRRRFLDDTVEMLLAQGQRSMSENGIGTRVCRYRGDNGLRCAIGLHIPDNCYKPEMEGLNVSALVTRFPAVMSRIAAKYGEILPSDSEFLRVLQFRLHDNLEDGPFFANGVRAEAKVLISEYQL